MPIHVRRLQTAVTLVVFAVFLAAGRFALAQAPDAAPAVPAAAAADISTGPALAGLRPALSQVSNAITDLRIAHWKAPEDIRSTSEQDVVSIQRDLEVTLPPMLDQAQATGNTAGPLAPSFAIFRNIDALYDVLLRVTEMANLAGSASEAGRLEDARAALESARAQLANSLFSSVTEQDAQIARLRAQIAASVARTPPPAPTKIVVDDGPESTPKPPSKRHKKKPAAAPGTPPAQ